jgi:hypothetical protein
VVLQVKHGEAVATNHQAELDKMDRKIEHEEDEIFKRIKREKSMLEKRKQTTKMTEEVFKHAQEKLEKVRGNTHMRKFVGLKTKTDFFSSKIGEGRRGNERIRSIPRPCGPVHCQ